MHVRPSTQAVASPDDVTERAQRAVAAFRHMQHGLTSYARAITGSRKVRVEVSSGPPRTDGQIIYYRPPIALGDKTPHDRALCDERDESGLKACPACRIREEVLVNIYHEIAHIAFGSFADGTNYMQVAARYNPYLPYLFNCLEDSRVDSSMFEARKGTRKMLQADTFNLLKEGVPDDRGELHKSADAPMNAQMSLATYLEAAGYQGWDAFMHPDIGRDIRDARVQELLGRVREATSAKEIYNLASPVLARLRELGYFLSPEEQEERDKQDEPEQDNEPQEEEQQDEGDPQDESGDEGDPGDGTDPGDGEGDADASDEPRADAGGAGEGEDAQDSGAAADDGAPADEAPDEPGEAGDGEGAGDGEEGADGAADGDAPEGGDAGAGGEDVPGDGGSGQDEPAAGDAPGDASDGAGEAGAEPTEPSDGGLTDGSDQDDVPGDAAGGPEPDGDSGADAGSEDGSGAGGPAGSPADAPDSTDAPADGGGDQAEGSDLGEGDPGTDADEGDASGDRDGGPQLDDGAGQGSDGSRPEAGPTDRDGDQQDESADGDQVGSEGPDSEGDRPHEVMESGADEGKGGVEVTGEPKPRDGNEHDVKAALEHGHPHLEPGDKVGMEGTDDEKLAIALAVVQGLYFETPSFGVIGVHEHQYAPDARGWDARRFDDDEKLWYGVTCDMDVSEKVLGPALLKTRRIFSDNKISAYQPNLRSGRVNGKVLGKRAWSDDDRLFGKKRVPAKQDYAVLIMMDISSSNLGDNLALLKRSVFAQAELCQRVGIKFAIVAHSASMERIGDEAGYAMHLHHVKEWDEAWTTDVKNRVGDLVGVGGNLDGHAMEYGRKMLGKVEATDKIMLYYTDGKMPAANKDEELEVLQRQIKLAKRDNITLLGVGIRTNSPVRHGLDTVQVDDDDDLKGVVEHLGKRLARTAR